MFISKKQKYNLLQGQNPQKIYFIKPNLFLSSREKLCLAVTFFTDSKGCLKIGHETNTGFSFAFSKRKWQFIGNSKWWRMSGFSLPFFSNFFLSKVILRKICSKIGRPNINHLSSLKSHWLARIRKKRYLNCFFYFIINMYKILKAQ